MKKLFLIALPLLVLASCSREPMELSVSTASPKFVTIKVAGDVSEETKTVINEANRTLLWGSDEYLAVYELYQTTYYGTTYWTGSSVKSSEGVSTNGGWTMTFDATFPEYTGSEQLTYAAIYPYSAVEDLYPSNEVAVIMPRIQKGMAGTFDADADILLGEPRQFDTQQKDIHFHFTRLSSILKLTINNLAINPGAKVVSVKLQTPNKALTNSAKVNLFDGTIETADPQYVQPAKSVKLDCKEMDITGSTFDVWFNIWPVTFTNPDNLTVYVTTSDGYRYYRTIIMQDPPLEIKGGVVTPIVVNMAYAQRQTLSESAQGITFNYSDPTESGVVLDYNETETRVVFTCQDDWCAEITGEDASWFSFSGRPKVSAENASYYYLYVNCEKNVSDAPKTATVTISNDFTEKSFTITQKNCVSLTGAALSQSSLNLACGQTQTLTVLPTPAAAENYTISWGTSDYRVASVDYDHTKDASDCVVTANMVGTATVTATVRDKETGDEFICECVVTASAPEFTAPTNILITLNHYIYKLDEDLGQYVSYMVPTVVHNGVEIPLYTDGGDYNNTAAGVTVANGKLVVTGTYEKNPTDYNNSARGACYWIAGKFNKLPQYDALTEPVADGNNVYAIASRYDSSTYDTYYVVLKNWEQVAELDAISVSNIVIDNGDWYVCGKDSGWQTCYWKNGVKTTIEGLYSASAIDVKDGIICIAGDAYDTRPNINVWHNGEVTKWSSWTASYQSGYADRVFIIGSDIWVIGRYVASGKTAGVRLYKNGEEVFFPAFQYSGSKYDKYTLLGAQVYEGQFYLLYNMYYTGSNAFHNPSQALWRSLYYEPVYVNEQQKTEEYSYNQPTYTYTNLYVTSESFTAGGTLNPPYENPFDNEEEQW